MKSQKLIFGKSVWLMILCGVVFAFVSTISAQPTMSRGELLLPISYSECIQPAENAYTREGWVNIATGGAFVRAFKENHGAFIMCNVAPENKVWANIVVASLSGDSGVPGAERVKLEGRMGNSDSPSACRVPIISGTYPTSGDPVGIMVIDSQIGNYITARYGKDENSLVNRMEGTFECNTLKGNFTNTVYNSTGTIKYTFSDDGSSFSGTWTNKGGGSGTTNGRRR